MCALASVHPYTTAVMVRGLSNAEHKRTFASGRTLARAELDKVRWVSHCRGLVQLPVAA